MASVEIVDRVADALETDSDAFQQRVEEERKLIIEELQDGTFDNPQANIGLEYEFYAVTVSDSNNQRNPASEEGRLRRVPRRILRMIGMEKELGLHNAEMCTSPQPFNQYGLQAQQSEVQARLEAALAFTRPEGIRLISDGMWTIPPDGESAEEYLTSKIGVNGIKVASNMSDAARYHAMANTERDRVGLQLNAPHVSLSSETVMPESLITSIQPHYQVPQADDLPTYLRYALRIAGPLLALGANTPFFPPDLYDNGTTIDDVLQDGWDEHRIAVFETVLNAPTSPLGKVRFPKDYESTAEAVNRIASDPALVPMPPTEKGRFDDKFAHFRHKHGTYWRWIRPVFDGPSQSGANARIEFRPLSGQPTVTDTIAFQAAFAGLMQALPKVEHPVHDLDWRHAYDNFYAAMRDGMDANLMWITNDGLETRNHEAIYSDLLAHAADGLRSAGVPAQTVEEYLRPLRYRVYHEQNPAEWKRQRAREAADNGADLTEAIYQAQRKYMHRQAETLLDGSFAEWLAE
ncbi:hypothetical protein K0C01_03600 [Salinarchaeum sp. IM2453]|uniref:hypothetical protein n=1 Tax=Salinarchaeum sp. IM2453 TaxID=2862870 RepID=UPI001C8394BE|nr:hypothetical protein [Salinarchaeum sp. IM2453]QZA89243.1 hypothetical protein K0C01_03600 [Salinarchaeum sp. IM2453]